MKITSLSSKDNYFVLLNQSLGVGEIAQVFCAYREGDSPSNANYAVKLARVSRDDNYIQREYETLTRLQNALLESGNKTNLPLPDVELGDSDENISRKALIMPVLQNSFLKTIRGFDSFVKREVAAIKAAKQYASLLKALEISAISCSDKKLGDLWWNTETEQLIVTDWNVFQETANIAVDIRRFGLLWFELLSGRQMPSNFEANIENYSMVHDQISFGLWCVIAKSVGNSMGGQFGTVEELDNSLTELLDYYERPRVFQLINQARQRLQRAKDNLDRSDAIQAWIQLDIAKRRGESVPEEDIETARNWSLNPIAQAAPSLLKDLSRRRFHDISTKLQELTQKAQKPQEKGDIQRITTGFEFIQFVEKELNRNLTSLAQISDERLEVQKIVVERILQPLIEKNGQIIKTSVYDIQQRLGRYINTDIEYLVAFEQEALFWVNFSEAKQYEGTNPDLAISFYHKAKQARKLVSYWPNKYSPSAEEIDRAIELTRLNLFTVEVADERKKKEERDKINNFFSGLEEDKANQRWMEITAGFLNLRKKYVDNHELEHQFKIFTTELMQQNSKMATLPAAPSRLSRRLKIVDALLAIPEDMLALDKKRELTDEQKRIEAIQQKIQSAQVGFFEDPAEILEQATESKYELFDDPGLSVVALKALFNGGRWGNEQLQREIETIEEQAKALQGVTDILNRRKDETVEIISNYKRWQRTIPTEMKEFWETMLQLYLNTALAQIMEKENASVSLQNAQKLLKYAPDFISEGSTINYEDLYGHLVELNLLHQRPAEDLERYLVQAHAAIEKSQKDEELLAKIEKMFNEKQFRPAIRLLGDITDREAKVVWTKRLRTAKQLQKTINAANKKNKRPLDYRFYQLQKRRRENSTKITIFKQTLEQLYSVREQYEEEVYKLFASDVKSLYEEILAKLTDISAKDADRFPKKINEE